METILIILSIAFFACVIAAGIIDYKMRIIPNVICLIILGLGATRMVIAQDWLVLLPFGLSFVLLFLAWHKNLLSAGDAKFISTCMLFAGLGPSLVAIATAGVIAIVAAVKSKMDLKFRVPFAAFAAPGYVATTVFSLYMMVSG